MSLQVEKLDNGMAKLTIEVAAEELDKAIETAYQKNKNRISIPGFRKGKAPRKMIEQMYGKEVFYEDAANELIPEAYEKALEECTEDIVSAPKVEVVQVEAGKPFIFTAEVALKPEVTLGKYKGVKIDAIDVTVSDADVDAAIAKEQESNARTINVEDRAVKDGDMTVIDFEGFVDGVAFEGGKGENYPLTIGSGQFIPGFEEALIGAELNKEVDVNVTFPEDYQAEELAGKPAVFKVKLHEIKVKELPNLDDEFAKDASEFDTLDELKADIKAKALDRKQKAAEEDVENQLIDIVVDSIKGDIPEALYENRVKQSVQEFDYRLQSQGMNLDLYMQYTGSSIEEFSKTFRPQAERQVKIRLALEKIVELEKIEPTADEVNEQIEKMAKDYGVTAEQVKNAIPESEIAKDLAVNKAIDLVKDSATVTDVKEKTVKEEKKAPAKKSTSTAKKSTTSTTKKTTTTAKKTTAKKAEGETAEKKPAAKKTTTKKADEQ